MTVVHVAGEAFGRSTSSCFLQIVATIRSGGLATYCLQRVEGRPGPRATVRARGTIAFRLRDRLLVANVLIVDRFAADGTHARQTVTGTLAGGGRISGGGAYVEKTPGSISASNLVYRLRPTVSPYLRRVQSVCAAGARAYGRAGLRRALPDDPVRAAQAFARTARLMTPWLGRVDALRGPPAQERKIHAIVALQRRVYGLWRAMPRLARRAAAAAAARMRIFRRFDAVTRAQLARLPLTDPSYRPLQQLELYMRAHHLTRVGQVPQPKRGRLEARARIYLAAGTEQALGPTEVKGSRLLDRVRALGLTSGVGPCLP